MGSPSSFLVRMARFRVRRAFTLLELTVVLSGHFADELGRYGPGDLAEVDGDTNHQPIADSHRDCICLIATDAPLRFTGLMGRLMQPFIGL